MRRRGFTLIELLLVIAIMATLAAIVAPSFTGTLARGRVDSTARTIVALAQAARARASAEGRGYILVVDGDQKQVRLERVRDPLMAAAASQTTLAATPSSTPGTGGAYAATTDVESQDWNDEALWAGPFAFEDGVLLGTYTVTDGLPLPTNTTTMTQTPLPILGDAAKVARVTFSPDGTSDAATIEITGPDGGDKRVVTVIGPSGRARIEEEEKPQ
jgi:type II secretion system protein H